jgi:hypothetical protein
MPREVWWGLFGSAKEEIDILEASGPPPSLDRELVAVLAEKARAGVTIRICIACWGANRAGVGREAGALRADSDRALELYAPLRGIDRVQIRLHHGELYNLIYRGDDELLVGQHVYGLPARQGPVLHMQREDGSEMFTSYLDSFERIWVDASA